MKGYRNIFLAVWALIAMTVALWYVVAALDNARVERFLTTLVIYEIAIVVLVTLVVMLLMRPRNRVEWATVGKEVAFNIIMVQSIYRAITGLLVPQPYALVSWAVCAILLTAYLVVFFEQWTSPLFRRVYGCCRAYWTILAFVVAMIALAVFSRL